MGSRFSGGGNINVGMPLLEIPNGRYQSFQLAGTITVKPVLSPSIKLQFLLLCFRTFLTEVVGRSCQNITTI